MPDSTQATSKADFAKRVAAVPIVHDTPVPETLHLAVAKLKAGGFDLLYIGVDRSAADKAAVFDAAKHETVEVFHNPRSSARYNGVRTEVVHHSPLKPGMTMNDLKKKSAEVSPELTEALKHPEMPAALKALIEELTALSDDDLKARAVKNDVGIEGLQPLLDSEEREDLMRDISEKEFNAPLPSNQQQLQAPVPIKNGIKGLGGK